MFSGLRMHPPPVDMITFLRSDTSFITSFSTFLKYVSPSVANISEISLFTISLYAAGYLINDRENIS